MHLHWERNWGVNEEESYRMFGGCSLAYLHTCYILIKQRATETQNQYKGEPTFDH